MTQPKRKKLSKQDKLGCAANALPETAEDDSGVCYASGPGVAPCSVVVRGKKRKGRVIMQEMRRAKVFINTSVRHCSLEIPLTV